MDGKEYPDYVLAAGMVEKATLFRQNPDMSSSAFSWSNYPVFWHYKCRKKDWKKSITIQNDQIDTSKPDVFNEVLGI